MALPENLSAGGFKKTKYGVVLSMEGGDDAFPIEVQRTSDIRPTAESSGEAFFPVGNALSSSGATTAAAATSDPKGSSWITHYEGTLTIAALSTGLVPDPNSEATLNITVARETLSSVGGTWVEQGTTSYTCSVGPGTSAESGKTCTFPHEDLGVVLASTETIASSTTDNIRLLIKDSSATVAGNFSTGDLTFEFHGFSSSGAPDDPHAGITWTVSSSDGGASSSGWTAVGLLKAGETLFREILPHTTARHWYRSRHVRADVNPGPFTSEICAQTARLLETLDERSPYFMDVRSLLGNLTTAGGTLFGDVAVESTGTISVRTSTGGSTSLTKTIRVPHGELVPSDPAQDWLFGSGVVTPGQIGTTSVFVGSIVVPRGVTLTAARAEMYRETTSDTAETLLRRLNDDHTTTLLATLTHSTTGWQTVSASLNQLVGSEGYATRVDIAADAGAVDARFAWLELDYQMPSYDKGY